MQYLLSYLGDLDIKVLYKSKLHAVKVQMPNFRSLVFKSLSENSGMMKDFDMLTLQEVYQILMISIELTFISV